MNRAQQALFEAIAIFTIATALDYGLKSRGIVAKVTDLSVFSEAALTGAGTLILLGVVKLLTSFLVIRWVRWRYGHWAEIDHDRLDGEQP